MVWIKIIYPIIVLLKKAFGKSSNKKPAPPSCGPAATPQEDSNSKAMGQERKQKEKEKKAAEGLKLIVSTAKISCPLCTVPMGTLMVTDLNPTIQNKPTATANDKGKSNLLFTGTCSKTPYMATPCVAVIQPAQWQDTGSLKVQNKAPLLFKSSIKCLFGGTDIKFIHSGQLKPPFAYDAPGPGRETEQEEVIDIRISVFFDGTGNNKTNTEQRLSNTAVYQQNAGDDSYENDFSNVARLFKYYKEETEDAQKRRGCVYIEGIGTENLMGDTTLSMAMGYGNNRGVLDKVKKGCSSAADKISKLADGKTVTTLTIDVFGFSRGAAASRNFLHEISLSEVKAHTDFRATSPTAPPIAIQIPAKPAHGELGSLLKSKGIEFKDFKICFAGLFDTVASYGLIKWNDTTELNLNAIHKARNVLHLTAMDERRANFPFINIKSKGTLYEKALPGVHSDIGGSYNPLINENEITVFTGSVSEMEDEAEYLKSDGWFASHTLNIVKPPKIPLNPLHIYGKLSGSRTKISNEYSYIPLFIMCDAAKNKPVYMEFKDAKMLSKFKIPPKLKDVNDRLRDYVFKGGQPMKFYTLEELEKEIEWIKIMDNPDPLHDLQEDFLKKNKMEAVSTAVAKKPDLTQIGKNNNTSQITDNTLKELDPGKFSAHPELQRKIKDHNALLKLRDKYLHISHNCSTFGAVVKVFDPYSRSVRAGKIREHYDG